MGRNPSPETKFLRGAQAIIGNHPQPWKAIGDAIVDKQGDPVPLNLLAEIFNGLHRE